MELWVDDRERGVASHLDEYMVPLCQRLKIEVEAKIRRLEIGDFCIMYKGRLLYCIERKTWRDFASSMRDGRKNNVKNLIAAREHTGCKVLYLVEGPATPLFNTYYRNIPYTSLLAHIDHLMMRDNIHIVYSKNTLYTLERLLLLVKNYMSLDVQDQWGHDSEVVDTLKEFKPVVSEEEFRSKLWCSLKFVSCEIAKCLEAKSFAELVRGTLTAAELAEMTFAKSGRKIGSKRAKRIIDHFDFKLLLCALPGVSPAKADAILGTFSPLDIVNGKLSTDFTINNRKIEKSIVGLIKKYIVSATVESDAHEAGECPALEPLSHPLQHPLQHPRSQPLTNTAR
jgi:ERCC4-type nuclease